MRRKALPILLVFLMLPIKAISGPHWVSGKITSLMGSANDPAIIIENGQVPTGCDGGTYKWLYFAGTAQEKQWIYSTALAMALTKKNISVYTNNDGNTCRIHNIQITSGLN